jgi:hypothetical protein
MRDYGQKSVGSSIERDAAVITCPEKSDKSSILRMILSEKSATPTFAGAGFFGIMLDFTEATFWGAARDHWRKTQNGHYSSIPKERHNPAISGGSAERNTISSPVAGCSIANR